MAAPRRSARARDIVSHSIGTPPSRRSRVAFKETRSDAGNDDTGSGDEFVQSPPTKRRKTGSSKAAISGDSNLHRIIATSFNASRSTPVLPPLRSHTVDYHRPKLLHGDQGKQARSLLLQWFDSVSATRGMPWRKAWLDPNSEGCDGVEVRKELERRAYEVWISEIMLQQTRVAVVIDYWNKWMAKWPTIHDLAAAEPDEVLAAWRGLGYYSRATRIHEAAKLVVNDASMKGLLPSDAKSLESKLPGVGRYTAGAISSIVFGRPEPMVDGNVLRVLSRQTGLMGNVKTDKAVIDVLWGVADALAKSVAADRPEDDGRHDLEEGVSSRPGRWGQGLMELGSTICTPKPNCAICPITTTCRVYEEGEALSTMKIHEGTERTSIVDVEDACRLCEPFEEVSALDKDDPEPSAAKSAIKDGKRAKQATLESFAFSGITGGKHANSKEIKQRDSSAVLETIANHAQKFPVKVIKAAVRHEETLVCIIRRPDRYILIHRRPAKGLLAGLWEFPSLVIGSNEGITVEERQKIAESYVKSLSEIVERAGSRVEHLGEVANVPWLFSHLRLTMHIHLFMLEDSPNAKTVTTIGNQESTKTRRWSNSVDGESMGTGMRKCWAMAKQRLNK